MLETPSEAEAPESRVNSFAKSSLNRSYYALTGSALRMCFSRELKLGLC